MKKRKMYNKGKKVMSGNKAAMGGNEPTFKTKMMKGGRVNYKHGGMAGCQPTYSEDMPKAKAN